MRHAERHRVPIFGLLTDDARIRLRGPEIMSELAGRQYGAWIVATVDATGKRATEARVAMPRGAATRTV